MVMGQHDSAKQVANIGVGMTLTHTVREPPHPQTVAECVHLERRARHVIKNQLHVAERHIDMMMLQRHDSGR